MATKAPVLLFVIVTLNSLPMAYAANGDASTSGQASQAAAPQPSTPSEVLSLEVRHLQDDIAEAKRGQEQLRAELDATTREIDGAKTTALAYSASVTVFLAIAGLVAFFKGEGWLREVAQTSMKDKIEAIVTSEFPRVLQERMQSLEGEAQVTLLKTAQVLALYASKKHDEALAAADWKGSVSELRSLSPLMRRTLIDCLYNAATDRDGRRTSAWAAVLELVEDDRTVETAELFLRLSTSTRRVEEGVAYFRKHQELVTSEPGSGLRAATLLRHAGHHKEALALVKRYKESSDLHFVVASASLERDLGDFGAAHDRILAPVAALLDRTDDRLPTGWHRLLNSYIAICIDRSKPEDAVSAADFLLRGEPGAVELSTVARLALVLPPTNPRRDELAERIDNFLPKFRAEEAIIRTRATLLELKGEAVQARRLLEEHLSKVESAQPPRLREVYYLRGALGRLLIDTSTDKAPREEAIKVLLPVTRFEGDGEVQFLLARASALLGKGTDAASWLEEAVKCRPRWAAVARDHVSFRGTDEVVQYLARRVEKDA